LEFDVLFYSLQKLVLFDYNKMVLIGYYQDYYHKFSLLENIIFKCNVQKIVSIALATIQPLTFVIEQLDQKHDILGFVVTWYITVTSPIKWKHQNIIIDVICVLTLSIIDPMGNIKNIYFRYKHKKNVFFMLSIENTRKHNSFC
jgi:hypothetical protein